MSWESSAWEIADRLDFDRLLLADLRSTLVMPGVFLFSNQAGGA